jgi:hypothetical protein
MKHARAISNARELLQSEQVQVITARSAPARNIDKTC